MSTIRYLATCLAITAIWVGPELPFILCKEKTRKEDGFVALVGGIFRGLATIAIGTVGFGAPS